MVPSQQSWPALDGATGEDEASQGREGRPEGAVKPPLASGGVRQRVRAMEARVVAETAKQSKRPREVPTAKPGFESAKLPPSSGDGTDVPFVFPLHVKRFVRRSAQGTPVRPETPLYRSVADDEPLIHAPKPTKSIPLLDQSHLTPPPPASAKTLYQTPPETRASTRNNKDNTILRSAGLKNRSIVSPAAFLHGLKDMCVRHGRRPVAAQTATKNMVERSRAGTYIPTGLLQRTNVEATSPWSVVSKTQLTKSKGANELCPDCVAELGIRRREAGPTKDASTATVKRHTDRVQADQSTNEDATPIPMPIRRNAQNGTSTQAQQSSATTSSIGHSLVVTRDLGHGFDAAIFQQGGELQRVILNPRRGKPVVDSLQKLSRDLASVSQALAFTNAGSAPASVQSDQPRAFIAARSANDRQRQYSIPELMSLIDQAASGYGSEADQIPVSSDIRDFARRSSEQSLLSHDDLHGVLSDSGRPSQTYHIMHEERFHDYQELQTQHSEIGSAPAIVETRPTVIGEGPTLPSEVLQSRHMSPEAFTPPQYSTTPSSPTLFSAPGSPSTSITSAQGTAPPQRMRSTRPALSTSISELLKPLAAPFSHPHLLPSNSPSIAKLPNPYHHAPELPRDLLKATWADKQVQAAQHALRSATSKPSPYLHAPETPRDLLKANWADKQVQEAQHTSRSPLKVLSPYYHAPEAPRDLMNASWADKQVQEAQHALRSPLKVLSPYYHAPEAPRDLMKTKWADRQVHETQQVMRATLRMEKNKAVEEAARIEREMRRQKADVVGLAGKVRGALM